MVHTKDMLSFWVVVNSDSETRLFVIQDYVHGSERLCGRSPSLSSVDEIICQQDLHDHVGIRFFST